jgi:hypothetical protein
LFFFLIHSYPPSPMSPSMSDGKFIPPKMSFTNFLKD